MSFYPLEPAQEKALTDGKSYLEIGAGIPKGSPDFIMSRSEILRFANLPSKWLKSRPRKTTKALEFGDLVDTLALNPDAFSSNFAIIPATYWTERNVCPKCGGASDSKSCRPCKTERIRQDVELPWSGKSTSCQEWLAEVEAKGKSAITPETHADGLEAVKSLQEAKDGWIRHFINASATHRVFLAKWIDEDEPGHKGTGLEVVCKIEVDAMPDPSSEFGDSLGDLKTTRCAELTGWTREVAKYQLYVQAPFYIDVVNSVTGLNYRRFVHLISENFHPFEATYRFLAPELVNAGRGVYINALREYCRSLETGNFRSLDTVDVELQPWMIF